MMIIAMRAQDAAECQTALMALLPLTCIGRGGQGSVFASAGRRQQAGEQQVTSIPAAQARIVAMKVSEVKGESGLRQAALEGRLGELLGHPPGIVTATDVYLCWGRPGEALGPV